MSTVEPFPPYPSTPPPSRRPDPTPGAAHHPRPAAPDTPTDPAIAGPTAAYPRSDPFYATGPHQPRYELPLGPPPARAAGRDDSLLDLHPAPAPGDDENDGPSRTILALAGLGILVLVAAATIVAVALLHDGSRPVAAPSSSVPSAAPGSSSRPVSTAPVTRTPAPSKTRIAVPGQAAARTIDRDISASVAARRLIGPATTRIRACTAGPADITALRRAGKTRTDLVAGLARLDVGSLPGGARVVADLRTAWTYSARADLAYAAWGLRHRKCTGHARTTGDPNWDRAHTNDVRSTAAKKRAVQDWNPVAARFKLKARSAANI